MKYLGIDYVSGPVAIGIFDSSEQKFVLKKFFPADKILGRLYYSMYRNNPNKINYIMVKAYVRYLLVRLLGNIKKENFDYIILANFSGSKTLLANNFYLEKKFSDKKIILTDHNWGYINSVKYHKNFKYPALVVDASARHSILAYLKNDNGIEILAEAPADRNGNCLGLGEITVHFWANKLKEDICWPGQPIKGKKNIYELYLERGQRGKALVDMGKYIKNSKNTFCEDVFLLHFPREMEKLKKNYRSMEAYKDDWVASQWKLLRDVLTHIRKKAKKYHAKTFFISGGISRNPALKHFADWLLVPDSLGGADGSGCTMAFLGYHLIEKGLVVEHDRWKNYQYQ